MINTLVLSDENTTPATDTITDELTKTYNELLDAKESNVEYYSITKAS